MKSGSELKSCCLIFNRDWQQYSKHLINKPSRKWQVRAVTVQSTEVANGAVYVRAAQTSCESPGARCLCWTVTIAVYN